MKKFSVIIPTHNKKEFLEYVLHGYLEQTHDKFELIIVNNACTDGTYELVNSFSHRLDIKQVVLEHKVESPAARNEGLRTASYDNIIHSDDDRIPCPQFIEAHSEALENPLCISIGSKHPILTILKKNTPLRQVSPEYTNFTDKLENDEIIRLNSPSEINELRDLYFDKWCFSETYDNFQEVRASENFPLFLHNFGFTMATGGNSAFNRTHGGNIEFDTNIKGWGCDDNDFFYRLFARGYQFVFNERAKNFHQEHPRSITQKDELKTNLKYLCLKYNRLEFYLWARTFMREPDFNHLTADYLYRILSQDSVLSEDYIKLLTLKLNQQFW